jgi:hypothetical protein
VEDLQGRPPDASPAGIRPLVITLALSIGARGVIKF